MKVLVIGATGATGKYALPKLLAAGHVVTAFVRSPDALPLKDTSIRAARFRPLIWHADGGL